MLDSQGITFTNTSCYYNENRPESYEVVLFGLKTHAYPDATWAMVEKTASGLKMELLTEENNLVTKVTLYKL